MRKPSRLRRDRFCEAFLSSRRRAAWGAILLAAGLMGALWVLLLVVDQMNRSRVPLDSPWRCFLPAILLPPVVTGIGLLARAGRNPLLNCPQCGHPLAWGMTPYLAIVTGRCPRCAADLFEDEAVGPEIAIELASDARQRRDEITLFAEHHETCGRASWGERATDSDASPRGEWGREGPALSGSALVSRADLGAALSAARRAAVRPTFVWGLSGGLLLVIGTLCGLWLTDLLRPQLGDIWDSFVLPVMLVPGISVGCWTFAVWERHHHVARPCPRCLAPIAAQGIASITGNCPTCGEQVVRDPFPGTAPALHPVVEPRWSIAEFRHLAEPRHGRLWIGCFVGAGLASVWAAPFVCALRSMGESEASPEVLSVSFICLIGTALVQCGGALLWHWYAARHLRCSACGGELLQCYWLVVSSRRCYHCGSAAVAETGRRVGE